MDSVPSPEMGLHLLKRGLGEAWHLEDRHPRKTCCIPSVSISSDLNRSQAGFVFLVKVIPGL